MNRKQFYELIKAQAMERLESDSLYVMGEIEAVEELIADGHSIPNDMLFEMSRLAGEMVGRSEMVNWLLGAAFLLAEGEFDETTGLKRKGGPAGGRMFAWRNHPETDRIILGLKPKAGQPKKGEISLYKQTAKRIEEMYPWPHYHPSGSFTKPEDIECFPPTDIAIGVRRSLLLVSAEKMGQKGLIA